MGEVIARAKSKPLAETAFTMSMPAESRARGLGWSMYSSTMKMRAMESASTVRPLTVTGPVMRMRVETAVGSTAITPSTGIPICAIPSRASAAVTGKSGVTLTLLHSMSAGPQKPSWSGSRLVGGME